MGEDKAIEIKPRKIRISEDCKYFKACPLGWECFDEFVMLYGYPIPENATILWSLQVCYDLIDLVNLGLIEIVKPVKKELERL